MHARVYNQDTAQPARETGMGEVALLFVLDTPEQIYNIFHFRISFISYRIVSLPDVSV